MRYTLLLFIFITACNSQAQNLPKDCEYKKEYVPHQKIIGDEIHTFSWNDRLSERGRENITTLNIIYKNGDIATIEHKFCKMYNFKISYFVANRKSLATKESAANLVTKLFKSYSMKNIIFTPSIEKILTEGIENYKSSGNENVEMTFEILPINNTGAYRRLINFYLGIGGIA